MRTGNVLSRIRSLNFSHNNVRLVWLFFCLIATTALAATPSWLGAASAGGSGSSLANAIKVASNGDQYVTGQFSSSSRFAFTTLVSKGGLDIFLAKIGASGKLLWVVQVGGPQDDVGNSVDLDKQGNIYLTGRVTNSATFGSTSGATRTVQGVGQIIFLAKYSPSGVLAWVQTGVVGDPGIYSWGNGVAVNALAGTVYITALSQENCTFSSRNGAMHSVPGVGTWHMVVVKYDTEGNFKWAQSNAASPNSIPDGIAVDAKDNAYITGWLENATTFSSADGRSITVTGFSPAQTDTDYPDDAFLAKYDTNGNVKWVNHIGGYKAIGNAVAVSTWGEVSIVGFIGNINFGTPGEAQTVVTSLPPGTSINLGGGHFTDPYNPDVVIATYNTAGVLQRALRLGGSGQETATGAAYDCRGNLYVAGLLSGATSQLSLFVQKYSGSRLLWGQTAVNAGISSAGDMTPAVSVDAAGAVFVAGGYQGTASFGRIKLYGVGSSDAFLAELAPN